MLTTLFSSPVRVKILKVLAMQSTAGLTAAEIADKAGIIVRSVNKEIGKLISSGAVTEESKPRELNRKLVKVKHYRANPDFLLYDEIRQLFLKLQIFDLDSLKEKLKKVGRLNHIIFIGKFIGDKEAPIDLLLVGSVNHKKLEKVIGDFEKIAGWEINWTAMKVDEYDYRRRIGDIFLDNLLSKKKIEIVGEFL